MPNLTIDLSVDRVDFVDEGANSAAFIELYKRKEKDMTFEDILGQLKPEHAEVVKSKFDELTGTVEDLNAEVTKAKEECEKACGERDEAKKECEKACAERDEAKKECEDTKKAGASFDETETLKSMPEEAREYVTKLKAQKEAAEEAVRKAREAEITAEAVAKAANLKALPVEQDKLVDILKSASTEVVDILTAANAAIEGTVLDEVGKSRAGSTPSTSDDAWARIEAEAMTIAKRDAITKQKAISVVLKEKPELYREYLEGGAN